MALKDVIGISRVLDPREPTNLTIAIITLMVGIVAGVVHLATGNALIDSAFWAVNAAGGVFLAWAFSREIDPDHKFSAFVSTGLAIISLLLVNPPGLLAPVWYLVIVRILNQTTGLRATVIDATIALGLAVWLAFQFSWIYVPFSTFVFFLNWLLQREDLRQLIFAGISVIVAVVLGLAFQIPFVVLDPLGAGAIPWLPITIVFIPVIFASREVEATCDYTGEPLNPLRLQAAQVVALLTAILISLFTGIEGALSLLPLWMAFLGVAVYRIGAWIFGRLHSA